MVSGYKIGMGNHKFTIDDILNIDERYLNFLYPTDQLKI